jgi:hypothetical protein
VNSDAFAKRSDDMATIFAETDPISKEELWRCGLRGAAGRKSGFKMA